MLNGNNSSPLEPPVSIADLLGTDEGADIAFEAERLGLIARAAEL